MPLRTFELIIGQLEIRIGLLLHLNLIGLFLQVRIVIEILIVIMFIIIGVGVGFIFILAINIDKISLVELFNNAFELIFEDVPAGRQSIPTFILFALALKDMDF